MLLIVNDSLEASSQTATLPEKLKRAEVWTRMLFGIVPENELQLAFSLAFSTHATGFPVNAYDIRKAWDGFDVQRREREAKERALARTVPECMVERESIPMAEGVDIVRKHLQERGIKPSNNIVSIFEKQIGKDTETQSPAPTQRPGTCA